MRNKPHKHLTGLKGANPRAFVSIAIQLVIIGGFIHHFNIEVALNLPLLFPLIVGVFLVHAAIPMAFRKWTFIASTCIGLFTILPSLEALGLILLSLGMIGICNLPIPLHWRKLILLGCGGAFAWLRFDNTLQWISSPMLTIIGSIFMFRMLLFVYELKYQKEPVPFLTQVSYFFMLPNVIFPLFPVVDYKLFHQQYFDQEALKTYQRGVYLIAKGILQLFLYRIIYTYLLPLESEVVDLFSFLGFISLSYLLTLRLAGIFNFSIGVLHLFGYRLPDVFNHHFLASSFSDLWRRINIYWKDFIVKLYFNPLYFKLKKLGTKQAIFLATLLSFIVTLFFHQYQTFWITGVLTLRVNDIVFWGFFGLIIAFGTQVTFQLIKTSSVLINAQIHVFKVLLTFIAMSILWSFWTSNDLERWLTIIQGLDIEAIDLLLIIGSIIFIVAAGGYLRTKKERLSSHKLLKAIQLNVSHIHLSLLVLIVLTFNNITLERFWNDRMDGNDVHALFNFMLKDQDVYDEIAGYYDQILATSDLMNPAVDNDVMWSKMFQVNLYQKGVVFKTNDAFKRKMASSKKLTIQGIDLSTNQFGMYDKEYSLKPPDSTYRVAFLGASIEIGWAIPYDQGLDKLIEKRFKREWKAKGEVNNIEVLNFSVPSRNLLNHNYALRHEIVHFEPDMVIVFDHDETDWLNMAHDLQTYDYSKAFDGFIDSVYSIGYSEIKMLEQQMQILEPLRAPLMKELFVDTKKLIDSLKAKAILVEMPELNEQKFGLKYGHSTLAKEAGFDIIDLSKLFKQKECSDFAMDAIGHPTLEGNRKIADALFDKLSEIVKQDIQRKSGTISPN